MEFNIEYIGQVLSHPLVLLIATAAISNYLIPLLTNRWQDHRTQTEIRTRFATRVIDSVLKIVLAVQFAERKAGSQSQSDYDAAYKEWEISRATLSSEIRGFFADPQLSADWDDFSESVTQLYVLSGSFSEPYRGKVIVQLQKFFPSASVDWEVLRNHENKWKSNEQFQKYFSEWWNLRGAIIEGSGEFAKRLLMARVSFM